MKNARSRILNPATLDGRAGIFFIMANVNDKYLFPHPLTPSPSEKGKLSQVIPLYRRGTGG